MDTDHPVVSGGPLRREPRDRRHPRLSRACTSSSAGSSSWISRSPRLRRSARRSRFCCRGSAAIRTAPAVYWVSLLFTFIGAAIFSTIRSRHARIPQEAIIGISYAVASAATILALSKSSCGRRAPEGHARREHPRGVVGGGLADGGPLRRHRRLPLGVPEEVPGDFDESRCRGDSPARRCGCGTFSSTRRSASS